MEPNRKHLIDTLFNDEWLDAALKQCGASEPRLGLEGRVLAGIRSEREHATVRARIWLAALAFAAAMVLIGTAAFLTRPSGVTPVSLDNHPTVAIKREEIGKTGRLHRGTRSARSGQVAQAVANVSRAHSADVAPHLEQFPSPLALSEQELILANYVSQFPHQALLMARAQTELLREEIIERQEESPKDRASQTSQEENQ